MVWSYRTPSNKHDAKRKQHQRKRKIALNVKSSNDIHGSTTSWYWEATISTWTSHSIILCNLLRFCCPNLWPDFYWVTIHAWCSVHPNSSFLLLNECPIPMNYTIQISAHSPIFASWSGTKPAKYSNDSNNMTKVKTINLMFTCEDTPLV